MDPKTVKLTLLQKVKPIALAINQEIPWQIFLLIIIALSLGIYSSAALPADLLKNEFWNFVVRRIFLSGIFSLLYAFVIILVCCFIEESLIPLINNIKENYQREALKVKKEVLDSVIEDEILK